MPLYRQYNNGSVLCFIGSYCIRRPSSFAVTVNPQLFFVNFGFVLKSLRKFFKKNNFEFSYLLSQFELIFKKAWAAVIFQIHKKRAKFF